MQHEICTLMVAGATYDMVADAFREVIIPKINSSNQRYVFELYFGLTENFYKNASRVDKKTGLSRGHTRTTINRIDYRILHMPRKYDSVATENYWKWLNSSDVRQRFSDEGWRFVYEHAADIDKTC